MKKWQIHILTLLCFCSMTALNGQVEKLAVPGHPRILLLKGEEANIQRTIASDNAWKNVHQSILTECDRLLLVPPVERIQIGRRLLDKSRECLRRVFYLSYAWRMTRDKKYFDRAEKELLAVAAFSDWNPTHFLDVAEMTTSVSIGYDWLYNDLSPASRATISAAIIQKGIEPSMDPKYNSWLKVSHNWNQVCNGGMVLGALAIYEDRPELAKTVINRAIESVKLPMKEYGPDGGYMEGYGYWGYGTSYNVLLISALEKAFGNDFGLTAIPGFLQTAGFMENMTGPSRKPFNFFDSGEGTELHPAMFWFAAKIKDPSLLWVERDLMAAAESKRYLGNTLLPAIMIWGGNVPVSKIAAPASTVWIGGGRNPVALMRSAWDANAIYVGMKGGSPSLNHGHMDVGSFVMDADGVRWAMDFGMQNYESLESQKVDLWNMKQNSQRWEVFRYNNFAHNTLTANGQLQNVEGSAAIIHSSKTPLFINAVVDMKDLYKATLAKATRGIAIINNSYVAVRDEVETLQPAAATIRWNMVTAAKVTILDEHTAELSKDGKTLLLQLLEPADAVLKTWPTTPTHEYDAANPGTLFIGFEAKVPANTKAAITVVLTPEGKPSTPKPKVQALSDWPAKTTLNNQP